MACNPGQSKENPCASLIRSPRRKEREEQESQIIPLGTRDVEQRQPVFTKDKLKFLTLVCIPQLAASLKMYYGMCLHVCTCLCVKQYSGYKTSLHEGYFADLCRPFLSFLVSESSLQPSSLLLQTT